MFNAIVLTKDEQGVHARVQALDEAQLPAGEVTVRVAWSTIN